MKSNSFQELIARIMLISICLQSCGGGFDNNPLIPSQKEQTALIQTNAQAITFLANTEPLVDQALTAQGGHAVTLYKEAGELKADVAMNAPQGFSKRYEGLEVAVEKGTDVAQLPRLDAKAQQRLINLQLAKGSCQAKVVIYKGAGLVGGMEGDDEEEPTYGGSLNGWREKRKKKISRKEGNTLQLKRRRTEEFKVRESSKKISVEIPNDDLSDSVRYRKPANQKKAKEQFNLGAMYENGEGVTKDAAKAFEWYQKAAEKGYAKAQVNLGEMYLNGRGVGQDEAKAFEWFKKAAVQGNADAQFNLGWMYSNGWGIDLDDDKAFEWYQKAAKKGNAEAQYNLGVMYSDGRGVTKDAAKAFEWYQKAAEKGDADVQYKLANMYENGRGVTKDAAKAFEWYQKAAEKGDADVQYKLANMYENGRGVTKDAAKAFEWYQKAAEKGHADAQFNLGWMYHNGYGITRDYTQAKEWYRKAAEKGQTNAQYNLGAMYENGEGVTKDAAKAFEWYQKAAEKGDVDAQFNLGWMYANGKGVEQDYTKAKEWYQKAANQGHADAQFILGWMYEFGQGVTKDAAKAVEWYQKAAEKGDADVQYKLANMYLNGEGVAKDAAKAFEWYQKAAEKGHAKAQFKVGRIYENGRGTDKDYAKAKAWLQKAADGGHEKAKEYLLDYDTDSEEEPEEDLIVFEENLGSEEADDHTINSLRSITIQKKLNQLNSTLKSGNQIEVSKYSEFLIPLYRGIHYLPSLFEDKEDRKKIRVAEQAKLPIYSASAYIATGLRFLDPAPENISSLASNAQLIKEVLDEFHDLDSDLYHKFHQVYSNDHKEFHKRLSNPWLESTAEDNKERIEAFIHYSHLFYRRTIENPNFQIKEAILRNPHVSFSIIPSHAVKYALGDKSFYDPNGDKSVKLLPDYDTYGKPKHPYLGKVYMALLSLEDFYKLNPYKVVQSQATGEVKITTHFQNNILKENEVTISGYLPQGKVVIAQNIRCPRFDQQNYPENYHQKYGLSERQWNNRKEKFTNQPTVKRKGTFKELCDDIARHQDKLLLDHALQAALKMGKVLIYPGFENDFVLFPLSDQAARIYEEIQKGKEHTINIKGSLIADEVTYILKKIINNQTIRELIIRDLAVNKEGFSILTQILQGNTRLKKLILENISPRKVNPLALKKAIKDGNQKVVKHDNAFREAVEGISAILEALKENKKLETLSLKGNQAAGEVINLIAEALEENKVLSSLDLGSTGLTSKKKKDKPLKEVFLGKNKCNTTIISINLDGNEELNKNTQRLIRDAVDINNKKRLREDSQEK
jgi:TPR repeat protein